MSAQLTQDVLGALATTRNVILEGVPGTGKTFLAKEVAAGWESYFGRELAAAEDGQLFRAIVMHPASQYEDLVEGIRVVAEPTGEGDDSAPGSPRFANRSGLLVDVALDALADPGRDYLVLLDELNRANVPKVLGDLMLALDASKRARRDGSEWVDGYTVVLPYSQRPFRLPDNVYVLGTMNTTDRSISPLDAALRRRFAFVRVEPMAAADVIAAARERALGVGIADPDLTERIDAISEAAAVIERLNEDVLRPLLGPDGVLGHSYLIDAAAYPSSVDPATVIHRAFRHAVVPQLIEVALSHDAADVLKDIEAGDRIDDPAGAFADYLSGLGLAIRFDGAGVMSSPTVAEALSGPDADATADE